jgi:hypothetical protein
MVDVDHHDRQRLAAALGEICQRRPDSIGRRA